MSDDSTDGRGDTAFFPVPPGMTVEDKGPLNIPILVPGSGGEEKADADGDDADGGEPETVTGALDAARKAGEDYDAYLERAIEEETCAFCKQVLRDLRDRPMREQIQGVNELQRLKEAMTGDELPPEDELYAMLESFEVVDALGQDPGA